MNVLPPAMAWGRTGLTRIRMGESILPIKVGESGPELEDLSGGGLDRNKSSSSDRMANGPFADIQMCFSMLAF